MPRGAANSGARRKRRLDRAIACDSALLASLTGCAGRNCSIRRSFLRNCGESLQSLSENSTRINFLKKRLFDLPSVQVFRSIEGISNGGRTNKHGELCFPL
jgi:hypothetical protein